MDHVCPVPVCALACLCPSASMCSCPCVAIYLPAHLCQFASVCLRLCLQHVCTHTVCARAERARALTVLLSHWVCLLLYLSAGHLRLLTRNFLSAIQTIGAIVSNWRAIKLNFPWRRRGRWWWWWWWGHFEVQMFLSHALLSEAVGCVGNVV